MEGHNAGGRLDAPTSKCGMRKYIWGEDISLKEAECFPKVGQVGRCRCIPSVVDQRLPDPGEQAFLTFSQPTPDFSLGQCGIESEELINLGFRKASPSERLVCGNVRQRQAEILN